jgi:hypothetical protein
MENTRFSVVHRSMNLGPEECGERPNRARDAGRPRIQVRELSRAEKRAEAGLYS